MQSRHLSLSLLIVSCSIFSMAPEEAQAKTWHQQPEEWLSERRLHGSSLLEMVQVWMTAPPMVKGAVEHLKDPQYYKPKGAPGYRFLLLNGEPGSGKSTLAKAMAMYAGWDCKFTTPADYQVGNRGDAATKLRVMVDDIIKSNAPTVLVIDEINQLIENSESKNHDNDATSKELWTTMDRIHGIDHIFIVGTSNRLYKAPPQIKSRIKARYCTINMPRDPQTRLAIAKRIFDREGAMLNEEGTNALNRVLISNKQWTGRDFSEFAWKLIEINNDEGHYVEQMGTDQVKEGAKRMGVAEEDLMWDYRELSDEDRQDLYQAQNMKHQLMIQRFQKHMVFGLRSGGLSSSNCNYIMNSVMSANQRRVAEQNLTSFDEMD